MPSPFPGMDPFIEGQIWTDFHHEFLSAIRSELIPGLRPHYVALVEEHVYVSFEGNGRTRVIRPDVSVIEGRSSASPSAGATAVLASPLTIPLPMAGEEVREPYLEIRRRETRELVTVIEVLSPANKRPGSDHRREYLAKRALVQRSSAHLVEIDLLRGGARLPMGKPLPTSDYFLFVSRAELRPDAYVWPVRLCEPLPPVPVPLAGGDPDVCVDLKAALDAVYDRAGYDYLLDYRAEVEPPLREEDAGWVRSLLPGTESGQGL